MPDGRYGAREIYFARPTATTADEDYIWNIQVCRR